MREQEIAMTSILIITTFNLILGALMSFGVIPVAFGMSLSFFGMGIITYKSWRMLMGDVRPWESPKQYEERTNK